MDSSQTSGASHLASSRVRAFDDSLRNFKRKKATSIYLQGHTGGVLYNRRKAKKSGSRRLRAGYAKRNKLCSEKKESINSLLSSTFKIDIKKTICAH